VWSPDGARFYVSGGEDDRIYVHKSNGSQFVPDAPFILLGHNSGANAPFPNYDGSILKGTKAAQTVTFGGTSLIVGGAVVAGLGVSRDGKTLVSANFENDSISVVDTASRDVTNEVHFFVPGGTVAQGEFPYDVVVLSNPDGSAKTAFVTSQRDDQVMVVDIASGSFTAIPVGDQPNRMTLSKDQKKLYVVNGNSDTVSVIDTGKQSLFFRGFDQNNADTYLFNEWQRDVTVNGLPNLTLLRLPHDHFGNFSTAAAHLNTPSLEIADNDYAIGKVADFISHSSYWQNTAIFILEDDAQDGGDHVDAHRSIGYVISPYSKRGVTISTNYNSVNFLRTMGDLLGIDHLNQSDANAAPMSDVFTPIPTFRTYSAIIPGSLCAPPVDPNLVPACKSPSAKIAPALPELHDATLWAEKMKGFNFHDADRLDTVAFNRILWEGLMGDVPYPTVRSGFDLRKNRAELLTKWQSSKKGQTGDVPVAMAASRH
jgi:DNA-binding beta-propeller fold protein YncE